MTFEPFVLIGPTGKRRRLQQARLWVEPRQAMTRTRHNFEQLWARPQKVDDLRNEKEEQCFAKVSENAHHGKGHA